MAPLFVALEPPRAAGTRAGSLALRVAASLPAKLRVTGPSVRSTRAAVGKRRRTVRVRYRAGRASIALRLALRADGRTTRAELVIARS